MWGDMINPPGAGEDGIIIDSIGTGLMFAFFSNIGAGFVTGWNITKPGWLVAWVVFCFCLGFYSKYRKEKKHES